MREGTVPPELEDLLIRSHFAYLCTVDRALQPHVAPVFYVFSPSGPSIYFLTSSRSKKLANIRSNPKVALTIDRRDPVDPQHNLGVLVRGTSEVVGRLSTKRSEGGDLYRIFRKKYRVFEDWLSKSGAWARPDTLIWVKIKPLRMTWWRSWIFETITFGRGR